MHDFCKICGDVGHFTEDCETPAPERDVDAELKDQ